MTHRLWVTGKKKGKAEKKEARKARKQDAADSSSTARRQPPTVDELARVGAHFDTRCPNIP